MFSETTWDAAQAFNDRNILGLDAQPEGESIRVFYDTDEDAKEVKFFEDENDFQVWADNLLRMFEDDAAEYISDQIIVTADLEAARWARKVARIGSKVDAAAYDGRTAYKGLAA